MKIIVELILSFAFAFAAFGGPILIGDLVLDILIQKNKKVRDYFESLPVYEEEYK